jgi:hypothetical protein
MAVRKKVKFRAAGANFDTESEVTMPSFSYSNDGLAQLIVNAWSNQNYRVALLERNLGTGRPTANAVKKATEEVNSLGGLSLKRAVVISEAEHDNHYTMENDDEVVFVLPNVGRQPAPPPNNNPTQQELLATAKLLMACTPNGI